MATRSTIAIRNPNGTVTGVYCHWDGYFAYNGAILRDHYQDESKVRELIALGNISSLAEKIGTKHDFDTAPKGECNFYGRDRGEPEQEPRTYAGWNALLNDNGQEYNYLFVPGEGWYVENYGDRGLLAEMMAKETEESN